MERPSLESRLGPASYLRARFPFWWPSPEVGSAATSCCTLQHMFDTCVDKNAHFGASDHPNLFDTCTACTHDDKRPRVSYKLSWRSTSTEGIRTIVISGCSVGAEKVMHAYAWCGVDNAEDWKFKFEFGSVIKERGSTLCESMTTSATPSPRGHCCSPTSGASTPSYEKQVLYFLPFRCLIRV